MTEKESMQSHGFGQALLTITEARKLVKLGSTTFYSLLRNGEIRSMKIGKSRRIEPAAIEEFLERLRRGEEVAIGYDSNK
jgi:excisionase family DNA binding protein